VEQKQIITFLLGMKNSTVDYIHLQQKCNHIVLGFFNYTNNYFIHTNIGPNLDAVKGLIVELHVFFLISFHLLSLCLQSICLSASLSFYLSVIPSFILCVSLCLSLFRSIFMSLSVVLLLCASVLRHFTFLTSL
jgi:hypothetical protein